MSRNKEYQQLGEMAIPEELLTIEEAMTVMILPRAVVHVQFTEKVISRVNRHGVRGRDDEQKILLRICSDPRTNWLYDFCQWIVVGGGPVE